MDLKAKIIDLGGKECIKNAEELTQGLSEIEVERAKRQAAEADL